jgi:hypothetical protein
MKCGLTLCSYVPVKKWQKTAASGGGVVFSVLSTAPRRMRIRPFNHMSLCTWEKVAENGGLGRPFSTPLSIGAQPAALTIFSALALKSPTVLSPHRRPLLMFSTSILTHPTPSLPFSNSLGACLPYASFLKPNKSFCIRTRPKLRSCFPAPEASYERLHASGPILPPSLSPIFRLRPLRSSS